MSELNDEERVKYAKPESQFSADELQQDPILRYFSYIHLPPHLRETSMAFADLANHLINTVPRNAERTVALRKLLEAKDAAVRAKVG